MEVGLNECGSHSKILSAKLQFVVAFWTVSAQFVNKQILRNTRIVVICSFTRKVSNLMQY